MAFDWRAPAMRVGPTLARIGYNALSGPAAATATQGGLGLSGMGGANIANFAPYLPVLGVAMQIYNAYTRGSGRNEPVEKYNETRRIGKLLTDLMGGKQVDWGNLQGDYGVLPKYLSAGIGGGEDNGQGLNSGGTIDPRGWNARELYDKMIEMSAEYKQTGGVGDSWFTGNKINEGFGSYQDALAKAMGMDKLPDWTGHQKGGAIDYKTTQPRLQDDIMAAASSPEMRDYWKNHGLIGGDITQGWDALDDNAKQEFRRRAAIGSDTPLSMQDDMGAVTKYNEEQTIKELNDKYKMGLKNPYAPPDPEANPFMNMMM